MGIRLRPRATSVARTDVQTLLNWGRSCLLLESAAHRQLELEQKAWVLIYTARGVPVALSSLCSLLQRFLRVSWSSPLRLPLQAESNVHPRDCCTALEAWSRIVFKI